ncbi:cytochrome c [Iamia majanohamensis]|uniref:Cytochrome c n=1 Tax=Iamia majanohamensis TaxID=467976 RepID=A0AAF0BXL5_9ACTN|nr:cytochrome c [Iamia majanohamensis]WCO69235.1 cytochrome c [Iamia majanohamensis]
MRPSRQRLAASAVLAATLLLGACGGDEASVDAEDPAARGAALVDARGCDSCHSVDGSSGVGPTWQDLAGSEVPLEDGTTVVADRAYLERSIREPGAQRVEGFTTQMPGVDLTDAEVADVVAYIESLSEG